MNKKDYIPKPKEISDTNNYSDHRSLKVKLSWFSNTRPDICCAVTKLVQITEEIFESESDTLIKENNKLVRKLKGKNISL